MSESLNAAIEVVEQADPTPAAEAPVAPAAAPTPAPAAEQAAPPQDRGTPQRGPDGKFLRRDASEPAPAPAPHAVPPAAGAATPAAATPAAGAADAAPPAWTPAAKEKWGALDPAVKNEIVRREREIEYGMSKATEVRRFGDSVMQEFAPYAQLLAKEGATPQGAIRSLLETVHTLRYGSPEHKHALFMSMAQQYGIDLDHQIDPEKARLQWELDSRGIHDARAETEAQQALADDVQSELQAFIQTPGHEHYDTVRTAMAGLIQTGVAQGLQDAYDRACWADPTVRAALQMAENARRVQEQGKNRNAMLAVNGAPGAVGVDGPHVDPTNLRALLESQFAGNSGRV
jgi:hypothetical protein